MLVLIIGGGLLAVVLFALTVRQLSFSSEPMVGVVAFTPYLMVAAPVAAIAFGAVRSWIPLAISVVITALCVATQAHLYIAQSAPKGGVRIVMMTSNLRLGEADPKAVVSQVKTHRVDVLTVQELTTREVDALKAAGLDDALPYSEAAPGYNASGVGIWSRYPLTDVVHPTGFAFHMLQAKVQIPGASQPTTVVAAHMAGPWPNAARWSRDIARLPATLSGFAADNTKGAVLVGGDFNATPDTAQFRNLLTDGYRDAADQAGAGMTRTYPADRWTGPLIAIDHVLTHSAVATSANTLTIKGSDHRALLTTIVLPR